MCVCVCVCVVMGGGEWKRKVARKRENTNEFASDCLFVC